MSNENIERQIEFIINQQAKFSVDIEQLKEVQAQQARNIDSLIAEMRGGFNNLILANEITRKLAEDVARLAVQTAQRVTKLEEKTP
jgi:Mg-chelatase subunit ChlI